MSKIVLQSVQFKASKLLEGFVKEKVSRLFEQDDSIIRADVTLFEGASGNPRNQFCEIQLSVPGENLFVKKNSESYEKSVLDAVRTLQKIIRRQKTKVINKRRS
ncbi:MAG: HPF/RaiA family ribosome-associated protein [Bacteroidota bacterium]